MSKIRLNIVQIGYNRLIIIHRSIKDALTLVAMSILHIGTMRPRKLSLLLHTNSTTNVGRLSTLPTRNPTPDSKSPIY